MGSLCNGNTFRSCLATVQNQTKTQTLINVIMQRISAKELVPLILDVGVQLYTQHFCGLPSLTFYLCWVSRYVQGKNGFFGASVIDDHMY